MKTNNVPGKADVKVGSDGSGYIASGFVDCGAAVAAQDMTGSVPTPIISETDAEAFAALSRVPVAEVNRNAGTPRTE